MKGKHAFANSRELQDLESFFQFNHQRPVRLYEVVTEIIFTGINTFSRNLEIRERKNIKCKLFSNRCNDDDPAKDPLNYTDGQQNV